MALEIAITGLGAHGEGVGADDGYTVFVEGALPKERVEVELVQKKKSFARGKLLTVKISSPDRVEPPCPYYGECGGCQLMHLSYEGQLAYKRQRVIDALERVGKLFDLDVAECIPSPNTFAYRNKIQLPAKGGVDGLRLGLFARSSHHLVDIEKCLIHGELGQAAYASIRKILFTSNVTAYDPMSHRGELRHLLIKTGFNTDEVLVVLVGREEPSKQLLDFAGEISLLPCVKGVIHNLNSRKDNVILGKDYRTLFGKDVIEERINGLRFEISAASFFQVNPTQAAIVYQTAQKLAHLTGGEIVLDAYCGVGTFSLIFASSAKQVIGVECEKQAVENAKRNAKLNGITNCSFVCSDVEDYFDKVKKFDLLLLNPPRQGCSESIIAKIGTKLPKKILYISCDPATLARDLARLHAFGYKIRAVQPFDMFPQTSHVETLVSLELGA